MKYNGSNINRIIHNGTEIFRAMYNGVNLILGLHDYFNRDDRTGLGIADTGQSWVDITPGFDIISNNAAARLTSTNGMEAMINIGLVDYDMSCDISYSPGNSATLEFRCAGTYNNKLFVQITYSALTFRRNINGAVTTIGTYSKTFSAGTYHMRVHVEGTLYTIFINEVQVMQYTYTHVSIDSNMGVGIYVYSYNARPLTTFDNLVVTPL